MNSRPRRIQSQPALKISLVFCTHDREEEKIQKTYNKSPNKKDGGIKPRQKHLLLTLSVPSIIEEKPENATQPIREPTRKQRTNQRQKIVEYGYSLCDNPRYNPHGRNNEAPDANTNEIVLPHAFRSIEIIPENAHVDVFSSDVAVYDSRNDDGGNGDAVGDFLE